ncbi:hypothetical protein [Paracoccus pacificus]|uniref:DUF1127 domain-containing protein n=1 Tax=Paracoccus pacificus TaxID=1463598 RepID=A0ABW4RBI6_9RHOB
MTTALRKTGTAIAGLIGVLTAILAMKSRKCISHRCDTEELVRLGIVDRDITRQP